MLQLDHDERPLICNIGWAGVLGRRIGFYYYDIRQVILTQISIRKKNMEGKIDRPEEYTDIATKCVTNFP